MLVEKVEFNGVEYNARHGGPFDRGSADSYYGRARDPHYYEAGTGTSHKFEQHSMTSEEIAAYDAGYDYNERHGDKKSYD
jgi:hypothetical protein